MEYTENIEKEKLIEDHIALQKENANIKAENLYLRKEMAKIKRMNKLTLIRKINL